MFWVFSAWRQSRVFGGGKLRSPPCIRGLKVLFLNFISSRPHAPFSTHGVYGVCKVVGTTTQTTQAKVVLPAWTPLCRQSTSTESEGLHVHVVATRRALHRVINVHLVLKRSRPMANCMCELAVADTNCMDSALKRHVAAESRMTPSPASLP